MNNAEKRRRARVQGGWAASISNNNRNDGSSSSRNDRPSSAASRHSIGNARSDKGKPKMPDTPVWLGKTIDSPIPPQRYVFQDLDEEIKFKPEDQIITKPGVFDISKEPSGVSRLRFFPTFISTSRSEAIFAELFHEIPWNQRYNVHRGVQALEPRLTAWYSDQPYTYSGFTEEANTDEWPSALKQLGAQLEEATGILFNSVAINLYRDGHDSIGWHSDDEPLLGENPVIASLSFGDERVFELRKKPPPNAKGERDYTYAQVIRMPLKSGALVMMEGCIQRDWQHRVPKEYHDRGARINITFRVTYPVS